MIIALSLGERLLRKGTFWPSYAPAQPRLKTQHTFLITFGKFSSSMKIPMNRELIFDTPIFPGFLHYAKAAFDLVVPVSKSSSLQTELKTMALATIHERYPAGQWTHIYTDGSVIDGMAGAGVFSSIFQLKEAVGHFRDNFDAEIYAICMALRAVENSVMKNIVLFVDSRAAIHAITDYNLVLTSIEFECKTRISSLIELGRDVTLQWIPSHCDVPGNERVDALAKEGCGLCQPYTCTPLRNIKRTIRENVHKTRLSHYNDVALGKKWSSLLHRRICASLPRAVGVACFRLETGHDYLQAHLFRFGLAVSPDCVFCTSSPMTGQHLLSCPALRDVISSDFVKTLPHSGAISHVYWTARRRLLERA